MQIIGHKIIDYKPFSLINPSNDIKKYENILFNYDELFISFLKKENKEFSIIAFNIKEIIIANEVGAKYIVVKTKDIAKLAQKIATEYLFDSKIALIIDSIDEIEELIKEEIFIDTVILKNAIEDVRYSRNFRY